ncbi:MAG: ankyrin repeat domain-containing protein, partial [Bacteroidia bacterium]|nr:ankyrin repeat domain-containing protein [Bacteroidia bacterium]
MMAFLKQEEDSYYPSWFVGLGVAGIVYVLIIAFGIYKVHQAFVDWQLQAIQRVRLITRKAFAYQKMHATPEVRLRYYGYRKGLNVDTLLEGGKTPLMLAAIAGDSTGVYLLLAKGADFTKQDITGQTPLHYALAQSSYEAVKLLAQEPAI